MHFKVTIHSDLLVIKGTRLAVVDIFTKIQL